MELRVLHYFLAIANESSITAAANALHITQPTLSRQLRDLEETLGVKLFARGHRRMNLTEEGLLLKKRAEEILSLVDKVESELRDPLKDISGDIYIGGGETMAMRFIANLLKGLHDVYPSVHFHLYSGNGNDVIEKLEKGLLDFGVLIAPFDISQYEHLPLPAKDRWGLLMTKDCPLAQKSSISPMDLLGLPLLISRQSQVKSTFAHWLGYAYEDLNIIGTYNLIYNASLMVEQGLGCALCLDQLVPTGEDSPFAFRPLSPTLEADLNLVWKKNQFFSDASKVFLSRYKDRLNGH